MPVSQIRKAIDIALLRLSYIGKSPFHYLVVTYSSMYYILVSHTLHKPQPLRFFPSLVLIISQNPFFL